MSKKYYSLGNELASKDYVDTSIEETKDYVDTSVEEAKVKTIILHAESTGFNQQYTISQSDINKFLEEYNKGAFFEVLTKFDNIDDLRPTMMLSLKKSGLDFFYIVIYTRADCLYVGDTSTLTIRPFNLEIQDNKASIIGQGSTHSRYPSAKAVYDFVNSNKVAIKQYVDDRDALKENLSNKVTSLDNQSTDDQYPSAKSVFDLISNSGIYSEIIDYNNQSTPFVFSEKKLGIYFLTSNVSTFYYKKTSNDSVRTIYSDEIPMIFIYYKNIEQVKSGEKFFVCFRRQNFQGDGKILVAYGLLNGENITTNYGGTIYGMPFDFLLKNYTQNISGVKTFTSIPKQSNTTAPTQDTEFTNKKYVDDSIAAIPSGVNYFDARQEFLFEGKDVGIYYPTNTNRINFMYKFLSDDTGSGSNGIVVSFIITNKVTAENPDTSKVYAVGTFLDGGGSLKQFVVTYNGTKYIMTYYDNYYAASMLTVYSQTFRGEKTFVEIPKVSSYSAPTSNTQLTAKKYVNDQDNVILNNIASVYNSSATYSIGDYVLYNGVLYVCNTDISTAEQWTAAHWTQTTVMTELTSKIGNINSILATLTTPNTNGGGE